jgi:fused signal recognition particle receptor
MNWFKKISFTRLTEGLSKTRDEMVGKINRLVIAQGKIDEETLEQMEEIFIGADIGVDMSINLIERIRQRVKEDKYTTTEELDRLIRDEMSSLIGGEEDPARNPFAVPADMRPYVIVIVGVNGVGKTTTIGKLAYHYKNEGYNVLIGAADTFRAAANEQLDIWAQRAGVEIVRQERGADPAAVAYDTVASARAREADIVIIDTAGRLHNRANLMEELKKIKRVIQKMDPAAPHEVLLVIDGSTGQNAIQQARQFNETIGLTGLIITKLDGTAKGGMVFAVTRELNIPVRFIGVGEQLDDLQPFDRGMFVDALFQPQKEVS